MIYLLLIVALGTLVYLGLRLTQTHDRRPKTRVIGPDDDPDFLSRLDRGNRGPAGPR